MEVIAGVINIPYKMTVCYIYIPSSQALDPEELRRILQLLPKPAIICGDLKAHHRLWDHDTEDSRGRTLANIIDDLNLITLNDGRKTFVHSAALKNFTVSTSAVDVTICSPELASKLNWSVDEDLHSSDHHPILIGLLQKNIYTTLENRTSRLGQIRKGDRKHHLTYLNLQHRRNYSGNTKSRGKVYPKNVETRTSQSSTLDAQAR